MSNYPIPVIKIASSVKMLHWQHTESWDSLDQMQLGQDRLNEMIERRAATAIANEVADDVRKRARIESTQDLDGLRVRFSCVALRRDELLDLLYAAYCEGQSDARRYAPGTGVQPL